MGRTWEKFSSLPAKKLQKFETATGKKNFHTETEGRTSGRKLSVTWDFIYRVVYPCVLHVLKRHDINHDLNWNKYAFRLRSAHSYGDSSSVRSAA